MRISDWSSDVCSSDLLGLLALELQDLDIPLDGGHDVQVALMPGHVGIRQRAAGQSRQTLVRVRHHLGDLVRRAVEEGHIIAAPTLVADRKSTRLHSSHYFASRMTSSA